MPEHDHADHGHEHGPGGHAHPHLPPPRSAMRRNGTAPGSTPAHAHDAAGGHLTGHDDHGGHGHDHGPGGAGHGHTHGAVDPSLLATAQGIHAVKISFVAMLITSVLEGMPVEARKRIITTLSRFIST